MPPLKKLKVEHQTSATRRYPFTRLPAEVLRAILLDAAEQTSKGDPLTTQQALLALSTLCKATRTALIAEIYSHVETKDIRALSLLSRRFKSHSGLGKHVKELRISIADIYSLELGSKKATTWKGHCLKHVLAACTSLRRLTLALGPSNASSPLTYLLRDLSPAFAPLSRLSELSIDASELWMHDLASILSFLPSLRFFTVDALLRGDTHTNRLALAARRSSYKTIKINKNSLASQHIAWLLDGQSDLEGVEMAFPGGGGEARRSFQALEKIAGGLKSVKIVSSWPSPKTTAAAASAEIDPPLPLFSVLKQTASSLVELSLVSLFAPPSSLKKIFALPFEQLKKLEIEDTAQSGMRVALCEALGGGGEVDGCEGEDMEVERDEERGDGERLPHLEEVVSVGTKRGNLATSETGKRFNKVCKTRRIKWVVL